MTWNPELNLTVRDAAKKMIRERRELDIAEDLLLTQNALVETQRQRDEAIQRLSPARDVGLVLAAFAAGYAAGMFPTIWPAVWSLFGGG